MNEAKNLVAWMEEVPDPRIEKMVTYPLVELLFAALIGVLCRMPYICNIFRIVSKGERNATF